MSRRRLSRETEDTAVGEVSKAKAHGADTARIPYHQGRHNDSLPRIMRVDLGMVAWRREPRGRSDEPDEAWRKRLFPGAAPVVPGPKV
jgi:hypothetical protein